MEGRPAPIRRSRKLLFAAIPALLAIAVLELVLRIGERRNEGPSSDDTTTRYSLQVRTRGGVRLTRRWGTVELVLDPIRLYRTAPNIRARGISTNSRGFRGTREYEKKKPPETRRIVLVGGSAAFGWGATDDAFAPGALLEAELARAGRPAEVICAGCPAYTSMSEALSLSTELLDYEPDLVVSLTGFNDMMASQQGWLGADVFDQVERRLENAYRLGPAIAGSTAIGRAIQRRLDRAPDAAAPSISPAEAAARFRHGLLTMSALVPGRLIVALQPCFLAYPRGTRPKDEQDVLVPFLPDREAQERLYLAAREEQRGALREAEARGARGLDLTALPFEGESVVFIDLCHMDDRGYERVAAALSRAVLEHPAFPK